MQIESLGNRLVAEYDHVGARFLYYTPDQINSTRVVTDSAGTVVYSAAHDPYGGIQRTWINSYDSLPKFSGKERDAESGLDYFGARYYDRSQYRFISADPFLSSEAIGDSKRWNEYTYCGNNPLIYVDSTGMSYLIFVRDINTLFIYRGDGTLVGAYDASNNPDPRSNGAFPNGTWTSSGFTPHDRAMLSDSIDDYGFYGFDTPQTGRTELGVHAGQFFNGWEHPTMGCIRTIRAAMWEIRKLHNIEGDKLTTLQVVDSVSYLISFIPALDFLRFTITVRVYTPLPPPRYWPNLVPPGGGI